MREKGVWIMQEKGSKHSRLFSAANLQEKGPTEHDLERKKVNLAKIG